MTQALTKYHALYEAVRSRRRKPEVPKGLDAIANKAVVHARNLRARPAWLMAQAKQIDTLAPSIRSLTEAALDEQIREARDRFVRGREDDALVRRGLALTREVARRLTGEEPFVVQLMAALGLYHGRIVEMLTGEGKTLTGSIAAPLIAWKHKHLHVLTVNDYLAKRDAESRAPIYNRCLLQVGAIQQEMDSAARFDVYARQIIYGTPKQITADYLRDQIRMGQLLSAWAGRQKLSEGGGGPLVPGLQACLVDEADAVLIDEGVVPLIIARSRQEDEMSEIYATAARLAAKLDEGPDYKIEYVRRKAELKRRGEHRLEQMFDDLAASGEPIWRATRRAEELVRQALVAKHCYKHGQQYHIVDGQIVIVDEYTGRFLPDRSWEHGLHQAVEAKEGVTVTADRETLARMSFQRFFRSYPFLCGMTGTVADATSEMEKVYGRPVVVVPTNRPLIREQWPMRVFRTADAKWLAIVESIAELHEAGRPVLVGTRSITDSEYLAERLSNRGLPHTVLNALHDKEEAELIIGAGLGRKAGQEPAITVATNMAGRGTDIVLDDSAREAGGLHVMLCEMHGAKRIDRQFIGRAGRQGDPGSAQVFVSLEDELIVQHAPRLGAAAMRSTTGEEIVGKPLIRRLFRLAQRHSEAFARRGREAVLRQDDWMEKYLPGA
ncbi:Protein translocase subunit SecA [hydrothermal vent metagenome]|uniref:Protein translocase subunit SecA n=1 Tax=hydrothermal vent metagenome TaxID=652676 RepID=A0A3B1DQ13_9ZZZZ